MATKYKYDKDTDYAALMERAAQRGDNAAAAIYEQQRNAKIRGEGMTDVTQSNDYAQYLPLEDVPDYDDTHRREAETLLTERDTTGQRARIDQMLDALLARFDKPACLEAELPETELAARRIGFYERHGFTVNADYPYFQPALTPGGSPIPLHLLTTGGARTPAELRAIETLVHTRVYGKTPAAMV